MPLAGLNTLLICASGILSAVPWAGSMLKQLQVRHTPNGVMRLSASTMQVRRPVVASCVDGSVCYQLQAASTMSGTVLRRAKHPASVQLCNRASALDTTANDCGMPLLYVAECSASSPHLTAVLMHSKRPLEVARHRALCNMALST